MRSYSLSHLSNAALLDEFKSQIARDRAGAAELLAYVAEIDARKLYVPHGFPSMFAYCIERWHMSEDMAGKRIRAARAARRFPAIFAMMADGRLHLTAVFLLSRYLTRENAAELLAAATHRTKTEVERLLADRFPQPDLPQRITPVAVPSHPSPPEMNFVPAATHASPALEQVNGNSFKAAEGSAAQTIHPTPHLDSPAPPAKIAPLAPQRYAIQVTIPQYTHDKLRHAQALLAHQIPTGDLAQVLDRALDALIERLEKRKFAATNTPRSRSVHASSNPRHIPADVKRAVRARDGDQCTFVSDTGRRCSARGFLEYDHVEPVARGGEATVDQIRLRCRAHNQYEAEQTFGAGFMENKREARKLSVRQLAAAAADASRCDADRLCREDRTALPPAPGAGAA